MIAPSHPRQADRLEALRRYKILDTPKEQLYDDVTFLAAQICDSPIAVVNFIDEHRQWFKAEIGLGVRETPLNTSICSHAILENDFLFIPDTLLDHRFADNPLCLFEPHLRFYAGALLKDPGGLALGTVCVLDTKPRELTQNQKDALLRLSRQVMSLLELRIALEETRLSDEFARGALESSTDCIKVLDLEGKILSVNQNGCRQMDIDDFTSVHHRPWLEFWTGAEQQKAADALQAAVAGKQSRFSGLFKTAKGAEKYWDVTVSPILNTQGQPGRILSIARDITNRQLEEAQMRETAKLESIGILAGGIAHDFNNLLTGILGNASLLEMSSNSVDAEVASQIVEAAQRAADLTRQLLAYSGKGRFLVKRIDLSAVILEILNLIKATMDKKAEIFLSLDENLPAIEGDPVQIQQLVMNLIINASEAMSGNEGRVSISTSAVQVDEAFLAQTFRSDEPSLTVGLYVKFEVEDTGSGMSAETISKIFDPFFTTKFTGRGLGLAAVSGILRGHRGAVRIYSELGRGSTFKVFLPAAPEKPKTAPAYSVAPIAATAKGWGTILLVDDEETVRMVAAAALRRFGYDVLLAKDGKQAIDAFSESKDKIRLIVLDLTMPVLNGEDALPKLRSIDPNIPVLLSSGYNQVEIIRRFTLQQITGFIQKPYTVKQFMEAVHKVLSASSKEA